MHIILLDPRGPCAGVTRAISTVKTCLERFNAPVYVKHAIVHNEYVIKELEQMGAIFVEDLSDIPPGSITIFSAHGSPKSDFEDAKKYNLKMVNATCPLVSKVHRLAERYEQDGYDIIIIGSKKHVEVIGTNGQIGNKATIVETEEDAYQITPRNPNKLYYITQTTLSFDDTANIVDILKNRFPNISGAYDKTICYATQNRQNAIKAVIDRIDMLLIIGSKTSSNSNKLVHVGEKNNIPSYLIDSIETMDKSIISEKVGRIAISAGASSPEFLVQNVISYFQREYNANIEHFQDITEDVVFAEPIIRF